MAGSINFSDTFMKTRTTMLMRQNDTENKRQGSNGLDAESIGDSELETLLTSPQKLMEMADNMTGVARQLQNRRDIKKKISESDRNFERVLDDDVDEKLKKIVEVVEIKDLSIEHFLMQARNIFPDESDLFLILKQLLKQQSLSEIQSNKVAEALKKLQSEVDPKALRGGINCALKARLCGSHLGLAAAYLRQTYRRFLEGDRKPLENYEDWISCYGFKARHIVSDFVEESLRSDIYAEDPSCSYLEFGNLLAHMRQLQALRTADCEFVMVLMRKKIVQSYKDEEIDWLLLLFGLIKQKSHPTLLLRQALAASLLTTHTERSSWLNAVRSAYKRLSPELLEENNHGNVIEDESTVASTLAAFDCLIEQSCALEMQGQQVFPI